MAGTTGALIGTIIRRDDRRTDRRREGDASPARRRSRRRTPTRKATSSSLRWRPTRTRMTIATGRLRYRSRPAVSASLPTRRSAPVYDCSRASRRSRTSRRARRSTSCAPARRPTSTRSIPALTKAAAPIGGGGSLNNVYSAIASMPGSFVPQRADGRQPNGLHPRRLLRPDRLRVRRRPGQSFVRQLSRVLGLDARPAGTADLCRRRRRERERHGPGGLHQPSRADRHVSRASQPSRARSARPTFYHDLSRSKPAARRPTASFPITSASAARPGLSLPRSSTTAAIS